MNKRNRFLSLLLAAVLVLGLLPAPVHAADRQPGGKIELQRVAGVNPHYADLYDIEEILATDPVVPLGTVQPQTAEYLDMDAAAEVMREGMVNREPTITVYFFTPIYDAQTAADELIALAMAHTGNPKEGDSLAWQWGYWNSLEMRRMTVGDMYYYSWTVYVEYYTTAEQEEELDLAVEELLDELDLVGKSDYEKICAVHSYICNYVTYDYESAGTLKHTAYAALINGTAVCQGYALLFYRLMLELGIDTRIISGDGGGPHGWNIVELDGLYYNVDATWDAGSWYYFYFLTSFWDFPDHIRDMEYDTIAFHNTYPMAAESYYEGVEAKMDPYIFAASANTDSTTSWYLNRNGTLELEGEGKTHDYQDDQMPYYGCWIDELTGVLIKEGITGLGTGSFADFYAIETVRFTGDAPAIASNAFTGVTATAYYPADNATWTADKLQNYGGILTWVAEVGAHTHRYDAVITAPTCTEQGYTTYTCSCGNSYVADYIEALGHDMGEWSTATEPTCTEDGQERSECSRCAHYETRAIAATGHSHAAVITDPTCTEQGYTTYTCSCGNSYVADYVDALGHDMGEWITVTEPTCTEDGQERSECSRCAYYETRVIAATGHSHAAVITDPTCTEQGYTTYTCSCGDSYISDYVDALGHDWDDGIVTIEPTEDSSGEMLYTCKRCAQTQITVLPELGHTHSYEAVITAPTCAEQGYTTYTCACGDRYVADYVDALGHDMGEWSTVSEPTCTEDGQERSDCSRCAHYETRVIAATGHSHTAVITDPTCTEQGYTTYTCACGDSYIADYVDALGHDYEDGICTRCGTANNPFTDVPEDQFYYKPVLWAVEKGVTTGATATSFNPGGDCQRAHVVTFLWRAAGQPEPVSAVNPFVDVKETDFYYKAVLWAVEKGITNGMDETHFGPFSYCNRAQVVTFLHRAMGAPQTGDAECPFTDVAAGAWFEAPILWAVENGITNGMGGGLFGVNDICNRAQVVTFLYRSYAES